MRTTPFIPVLLCLALIVLSSPLFSQDSTGTLLGTVRDQATGEVLVGANVLLVGTSIGAVTDLDGKYEIRLVKGGVYPVRVSFVGYTPQLITGVRIAPGVALRLDLALGIQAVTTEEVVVTAERQLSSESALLAARRKSAVIGDGISIEQVKRSPDATAGDALRRVTGVSIVDNKFVYVRGVTDRYNGTMLNGVSVSSTDTDVDKKSFSFDLVPANLIENTIIAKTATPDLPGDFTGGLVQVTTTDFPDERVLKFSLGTSVNTISNTLTMRRSPGGGKDWLGMDDGSRAFPTGATERFDLARKMTNTWSQREARAPLNGSFGISYGDRAVGESAQLGYIGSLSYRSGFQRAENTQDYFRMGSRIIELRGTNDRYSVFWGGLLDLNVKLGGMHKVSFKNTFSQSGEDKVIKNRVIDENENLNDVEVTQWSERNLYLGQLVGDHRFPSFGELETKWRLSYSSSRAEEPDRKTSIYNRPMRAPDSTPYTFTFADRSWSQLYEDAKSASLDLSFALGEARIKLGGLLEAKRRQYQIHFYQVELGHMSTAFHLLLYGRDSIFAAENFAPDKMILSELSDPRDTYTATHVLRAGYLMADLPFMLLDEEFRFVGGVRFEDSDQKVNTISPFSTNEPYIARVHNLDPLPSANLTYLVSPVMNLRLAYSHSVNRPEFRELAAFYFYDYNSYEGTYGNPLLKRATARNYDVRWEIFPSPGEVFAASFFYKSIQDAIEQKIVISSNPERTWFNSGRGSNYGWEVEARTSFGFLGGFFAPLTIAGNYTRINSAIEYADARKIDVGGGAYIDEHFTAEREMQGQSPYTLNLSLSYHLLSTRTAITVLYNEFGNRLDAVGDRRELDVYELSRGTLDLTLSQAFGQGIEAKVTLRDAGGSRRRYETREGNPYRSQYTGRTFGIQLSAAL